MVDPHPPAIDPSAWVCPTPPGPPGQVLLGHGGGGRLSQQLLDQLILPALGGRPTDLHDAALLPPQPGRLAFTTDSYVVQPLQFPGGDIGSLAVIGSLNDLAMAGAIPVALSLGLIAEEGLPLATLESILGSIGRTARECGVAVVTGDTKVVERGKGDGLFINTAAIGRVEHQLTISPRSIRAGDALLVSGDLGRHGVAILAARHELGLETDLASDLAPLQADVQALLAADLELHCLRDLTRGGLASALVELARGSDLDLEVHENALPVGDVVRGTCELLGLEPMAMANEGRMVVVLPREQAPGALDILRQFHADASVVGEVLPSSGTGPRGRGPGAEGSGGAVLVRTALGVRRPLVLGQGELLPRIC